MNLKTIAFAATAAVGLSTAASATTVTALVDFTDTAVWSGSTTTANYGDLKVTVSTTSVAGINFNQFFDGTPVPAAPLAFKSDGLGVGDDEITFPLEIVTVAFSKPVKILEAFFLDLFGAGDFEVAHIDFGADGSVDASFTGVDPIGLDLPGFLASTAGLPSPMGYYKYSFLAGKTNDTLGKPDFALAGLNVEVVPLPASALLLLGGLAGIAAVKRRKSA